ARREERPRGVGGGASRGLSPLPSSGAPGAGPRPRARPTPGRSVSRPRSGHNEGSGRTDPPAGGGGSTAGRYVGRARGRGGGWGHPVRPGGAATAPGAEARGWGEAWTRLRGGYCKADSPVVYPCPGLWPNFMSGFRGPTLLLLGDERPLLVHLEFA